MVKHIASFALGFLVTSIIYFFSAQHDEPKPLTPRHFTIWSDTAELADIPDLDRMQITYCLDYVCFQITGQYLQLWRPFIKPRAGRRDF